MTVELPLSPLKRALLEIRNLRAQIDKVESARNEPIAIVGMGCRYPGAVGLKQFWEVLCAGTDTVSELPDKRWDADLLFDPDPAAPGKMVTRRGGFLSHLDEFDAEFFHITPREASFVDPRQRLVLECAWEALEDAGLSPFDLTGSQTGVYMATLTMDYGELLMADMSCIGAFSGAGSANSVVANRLSYFLNLHGPSISIDTACSGSIVAVHMACEALRNREIGLALAGGVSVNLQPRSNVFFSKAGALSPEGSCKTFDRRADGMVRSDGAGVVVLKLLSEALRDGDPVAAVIRSVAINHDGRSNGIMAPNGEAQVSLLEDAYRRAGIDPSEVQYIQAHGTGTKLGDPIEVRALGRVLARDRNPARKCVLGSVKTNIGHTESAAGVAGIIATALALKNRILPPTVHFSEANPLIPFDQLPFEIRTQAGPWPDPAVTRIAGVSGFGFGGSNAHVVLEEAPVATAMPEPSQAPYLLPLSARTAAGLRALATACVEFLEDPACSPSDICFTAAARRAHHGVRKSWIGVSSEDLAASLKQWLQRDEDAAPLPKSPLIAFVFSGQGSHWAGMGRRLLNREPVFREAVERCERAFAVHTQLRIIEEMCREDTGSRLNDPELAQPAIFSIQTGLAALWASWGIVPSAIVGHSLGEVAAACAAGALSLEDGARIVWHRSRLMKTVAGRGKTAVVGLGINAARLALAGREETVVVAGSNGPENSVISGNPEAVDAVVLALTEQGVFCRPIAGVDIAFHSPQMDSLRWELVAELEGLAPKACHTPLISTVTGLPINGADLDAEYWGRNLRDQFLFASAAQLLLNQGHNILLEVSPNAVLSSAILQTLKHAPSGTAKFLPSLRRGDEELAVLYGSLGTLYELGAAVNWKSVHREGGRCVSFPTYPWMRQRFWIDQIPGSIERTPQSGSSGEHPLLGPRVDWAAPPAEGAGKRSLWEMAWSTRDPSFLSDHRLNGEVIVPGAAFLELALAAGTQLFPVGASVCETVFERAVVLAPGVHTRLQLSAEVTGNTAEFVVYGRCHDANDWNRYVSGKLVAAVGNRSAEPAAMSLSEIRSRCAEIVDVDSHYQLLESGGLQYGPAFRCIRQLWRGNREAVSQIRFDTLSPDARYIVHPSILDAAFQTVAAAVSAADAANYLPYSVHNWEALSGVETSVWCHCRLSGEPGAKNLDADLTLMDDVGRVVARLERLTLRSMPRERSIGHSAGLLHVLWESSPLPVRHSTGQLRRWLVLSDGGCTGSRLIAQLRFAGCEVTVLLPYPSLTGEDFEVLLQSSLPFHGVVHLQSLDARADSLDEAVSLTCESVIRLALAMVRSNSEARLWLVTRGAQPAAPGPLAIEQSPLWGLALSVAREHPELRCTCVDLDPSDEENGSKDDLAGELLRSDNEDRIAWRGGMRFAARLTAAPGPPDTLPPELHPDGLYLVTGGFGVLGFLTARYLVEIGARHLAIVSRGGGAGHENAIRELELAGARVTAISADLADKDQTERLFSDTLSGLPPLRGIIHSAGMVSDATLEHQTPERLRMVMAPKVQAAFNLHTCVKNLPLDFFILYSSAASQVGSPGQANYAAGNAFLDALAHHRRALGLAALTVNWGAWDGGMAGTVSTRQFAAHGVSRITPGEGLGLLGLLLNPQESPNVGLFPVDWRRFFNQFGGRIPPLFSKFAHLASSETVLFLDRINAASKEDRPALVHSFVRAELASVLGIDSPTSISARDGFFDLGMDSLLIVELSTRLEAGLGLKLSANAILEFENLESLSAHLSDLAISEIPSNQVLSSAVRETGQVVTDSPLESLSSTELARLLKEELGL